MATTPPPANVLDAGTAALELWGRLAGLLVGKGVLTEQERVAMLDQAIVGLDPNPATKGGADVIRNVFKRP